MHLELMHRETGKATYAPARCGSWRHAGECRRKCVQTDYARVMVALEPIHEDELTMAVLTLDQKKWKARGLTPADAYRQLQPLWQELERRLARHFGGRWPYISTVEAHRAEAGGWPHLNVILCHPVIAAMVRIFPEGVVARWWKDLVAEFGFGWRTTIEPIYSKEGAASYVTKHENLPKGAATSEAVKLSQLPLNAPSKTRRLRSSKGFLPKRFRSGEWTGRYVSTPLPEVMQERQQAAQRELDAHLGINLVEHTTWIRRLRANAETVGLEYDPITGVVLDQAVPTLQPAPPDRRTVAEMGPEWSVNQFRMAKEERDDEALVRRRAAARSDPRAQTSGASRRISRRAHR